MGKTKDDFTGLDLLLNQPTRRGKPGRLRSDLAEAGADILDTGTPEERRESAESAEKETGGGLGEWDTTDFEDPAGEDPADAYRPRTRVRSRMLHVRLALSVHRLMSDFLAEQKMTMQEFMLRIVAMELRQRMPARARRLRVPPFSPLNLQRTQAYLPRSMHTALKNRALEYDMSLQDLVTRLVLYRVKRGRRPRPVQRTEKGL